MSHTLKHTFSAAILAASAWSLSDPAYASVGDTVTNIATVTYTAGGVEGELSTNPAIFTIRAPDITPTIEFFRHAPNAGDTISVAINGSGRIIDTSGPLPLTPAEVYLTGELMFVTVTDSSANQDTPQNDNQLTTGNNARMTATYVNIFTESEVVVDTALVDPSNFVFDSVTGEPIDGAVVTIINADTNEPARVYGVDGVSSF